MAAPYVIAARPLASASLASCLLLLLPLACASAAPADSRALAHVDAGTADDNVGLLQKGARARGAASGGRADLAASPAALTNSSTNSSPWVLNMPTDVYCRLFPSFCKPPFDCQTMTFEEVETWDKVGRAPGGKPNLRTWCVSPQFSPLMSRCAAGDISGAGKVQYDMTQLGLFGPTTMEADGSYCFIEGLCLNDAVTNDTTVAEASEMCTQRFGADWINYSIAPTKPEETIGYDLKDGFHLPDGFTSNKQTRPYILCACAMGNFHCDTMMCREHYCKNPYYVHKYGHFLKDYGWVK